MEGPAGSGKTIVMLGKIIDIVSNKDIEGRVLVMTAGPRTNPALIRCHGILDNISDDITCTVVEYSYNEVGYSFNEPIDPTDDVIAEAERNLLNQVSKAFKSRIVILAICRTRTLTPDKTCLENIIESFSYVFVDDYQRLAEIRSYDIELVDDDQRNMLSVGLLPVIMNPSANDTNLWVFCDVGQSLNLNSPNGARMFLLMDKRNNPHNFVAMFEVQKMFSVNLRNTHEISAVLSVIREHWETMEFTVHGLKSTLGLQEDIPHQKNGHFLRGFTPTIYLLRNDNPAAYLEILDGELCKLRGSYSSLDNKDIAVLYKYFPDSEHEMELLNMHLNNDQIAVLAAHECMSAEWPAVVYLHNHRVVGDRIYFALDDFDKEIRCSFTVPALYSALCRGRVYSTTIIYNYTPNTCKYTDILLSKLSKRKDVCRILDVFGECGKLRVVPVDRSTGATC